MITVLLIIHLFVTLALIGVVLIQRSEGGGLGIGTSQGMGCFMSGRGTANLLTRTTAILATVFMVLSLTLALMNRGTTGVGGSILDVPPTTSGAPSGARCRPRRRRAGAGALHRAAAQHRAGREPERHGRPAGAEDGSSGRRTAATPSTGGPAGAAPAPGGPAVPTN